MVRLKQGQFLGLLRNPDTRCLAWVLAAALTLRNAKHSRVAVTAGAGGSNLDGRAALELLLSLAQLAGDLFDDFGTEIVQDAVDDAGDCWIGF